jgi:hypothetical protein
VECVSVVLVAKNRRAHLDEVDLCESLVVSGLLDVEDGDDVLVVEVAEQLHLSQRSQTEHGVVEGCDLLDGDLLARRLVQRRAVSSQRVRCRQYQLPRTRQHRMRPLRRRPGCHTAQRR